MPSCCCLATVCHLWSHYVNCVSPAGCLENIDVLTGLTSLSLSHAGHDAAAASMDHTMPGSSMPSMAAAPAGSSSSGGSTGRGGRPSFGLTCSVLPAAMSNLQELQVLKLENIPPSYEVLMPLTTLKQLELRVRKTLQCNVC